MVDVSQSRRFAGLHFEVTNKCNLRCKHCYNIEYIEKGQNDLSTKEVLRIISIASKLGCKGVALTGGEPFMRDDILEIIEACPGSVRILTNLLMLEKTHSKHLSEMNKLLDFRVSLDGIASHRAMRGVDYTDVVQKIKILRDDDHIITVNTMITPYNYDELEALYELMIDMRIDRWRIDFIFAQGNANRFDLRIDKRRTFVGLKKIILRYLMEKPLFDFDVNKIFRSVFLNNKFARMTYTCNKKPCAYQGALTVKPNGDVTFCASMNEVCGNLLNNSIGDIINHPSWTSFSSIAVRDLNQECLNCKYLIHCGGGCRADGLYASGDISGKDQLTCDIMEFYVEEILPHINAAMTHSNAGME